MTQASQALPSWLTLTSTVITDQDGGLSTSFGTLTLPLTYYGPPIPLGTDGTWVYGGLSSPPPMITPSSAPPPIPPATPSPIPSVVSTSTPSSQSSSTSFSSSSSSSGSTPTQLPTPVSHGLSKAVLGGIIGGILGAFLLLILILTLWILRRNQNRRLSGTSGHPTTSSFWNRQTTLFTADPGSTPIWTGWDLVSPAEAEDGNRTPGDGSPRHSGEEADPFLRRRSGTIAEAEEMAQIKTGTDTLVSLPVAAMVGTATTRPSPPRSGNIIPRDVINRMMDEDYDEPSTSICIVEPSPQVSHSPLVPPPMLNPDALGGIGIRASRNISQRSLGSQNRSIGSQKSIGSLEDAELRVARRVRVGELGPEAGPSRNNNLRLQNISGRLSSLSWFRRMSLTAAGRATQAAGATETASPDSYTRSPTRSSHSRQASRSRPSSYVRFQEDLALRPPRVESGLGYNSASSRPISTVSGKSTSAASGNTVYHDAVSTPTSDIPDVPEIPERFQTRDDNGSSGGNGGHNGSSGGHGSGGNSGSGGHGSTGGNGSLSQQSLSHAPGDPSRFTAHGIYASIPNEPPPTYDDNSIPRHRAHTRLPSDIDVLDLPAPPPVSPFSMARVASASASSFPPPGLGTIPNAWRGSYPSNQPSPLNSAGIGIDIEDEPPVAAAGWRSLTSVPQEARRTTFGTVGTPVLVNSPLYLMSEQGSLHSMRSHLSPYASRSAIGSAPASSHHTLSGSGSSRPSAHSHARTGSSSLVHSSSVSSFEHRGARRAIAGNLASPPLSAIFGGRARSSIDDVRAASPPLSPRTRRSLFPPPVDHDTSPTSSRTPLLAGEGTVNSQTGSSITTALTDPITGTVMHFPSMPWRNGPEHEHDTRWNAGGPSDEEWP